MFLAKATGGTAAMRHLAEDVVNRTMTRLLPRHRKPRLIEIEIRNTRKEGFLGLAYFDDDTLYIDVENKPQSLYHFVETLCHECVHLKQYVKKELKINPGKQLWMGDDYTDTAYRKQPWEKEAYGKQKELTKEYLHDNNMSMRRAKELSARAKCPWWRRFPIDEKK